MVSELTLAYSRRVTEQINAIKHLAERLRQPLVEFNDDLPITSVRRRLARLELSGIVIGDGPNIARLKERAVVDKAAVLPPIKLKATERQMNHRAHGGSGEGDPLKQIPVHPTGRNLRTQSRRSCGYGERIANQWVTSPIPG